MLRLILLGILLLLSLLTVFKALTYHLWLCAIIATEFPLFLVIITSALLICGFWTPRFQLVGTLVGMLAILLYLSPVVRSYSLSRNLEPQLISAFGGDLEDKEPFFKFSGLMGGNRMKKVDPQMLVYASDQNLSLDFYPSAIDGKRPCVVVIHGGSWKSGDNKQLPELNTVLANTGYHVAAINYRLAPLFKNPAAVNDVAAAINHLKLNAEKLRIDSDNFVLLGRSAGAQIALLAAYTLPELKIKGVIDFYGPADMVWGYSVPSNPLVMDSRKVMEDYLGGTYSQVPKKYQQSSPIRFANKNSPPTLIIHGENDVLVAYQHSTKLHKRLKELGVKTYFLSLPWATHGFDYNINGPGGQLSTFAVRKFVENVTKPL